MGTWSLHRIENCGSTLPLYIKTATKGSKAAAKTAGSRRLRSQNGDREVETSFNIWTGSMERRGVRVTRTPRPALECQVVTKMMWSLIIWKGMLIDGLPYIPFVFFLIYFWLVVFLCMLMLPLRYHIPGWTVSANLIWAIPGVPSLSAHH